MDRVSVKADFNGLFGDMLCLSHTDSCLDEVGAEIVMRPGMVATAFDNDADDLGNPCFLVADGVVEKSPDWLQCRGSRWALHIDDNGVRHQTQLAESE